MGHVLLRGHPSSPVRLDDPFGFLTVETQLRARKIQENERRTLQHRATLNEKLGSRLIENAEPSDAVEEDNRPAFATPERRSSTSLSPSDISSSSEQKRRKSRKPSNTSADKGVTQSAQMDSELQSPVKRTRPGRATDSKRQNPKRGGNGLNKNNKGKENVFSISSDYLDTLPHPPVQRGLKSGAKTKRVTSKHTGSIHKGKGGPKSTSVKNAGTRKRGDRPKQMNEDKDKGEEIAEVPQRVGESFVLDGEEREVRSDRRPSLSRRIDTPARFPSNSKPNAKHGGRFLRKWTHTSSKRKMCISSDSSENCLSGFCLSSINVIKRPRE